jgi:predicted metal-dependent phosphoesterase TrpH
VEAALEENLAGLAITDHDTVSGLSEAIEAARDTELVFVPGVEISAEIDRGALHILGLYVNQQNEELQHCLRWLEKRRNERNGEMARKLTSQGMPIDMKEVAELSGGKIVGRPHFAQFLVKNGYVKSIRAAFQKHLGIGKSAYVPKEKLTDRKAIETIITATGVPVLAHPDQTYLEGPELFEFVQKLTDYGLGGIEVYYPGYANSRSQEYMGLAQKLNLVRSGGSDFHGSIKPAIRLGRGTGKLYVPDTLLDPLAKRAEKMAGTCGNRTHLARY